MSSPSNQSPICRALDQGFGFTKFTTSQVKEDGTLDVQRFPSYTRPSTKYNTGALHDLDVIKVDVEGVEYLVGEDAISTAMGDSSRMLDQLYFDSPEYLALARAALSKMRLRGNSRIDHLTVGLPLNYINQPGLVSRVRERLQGRHIVKNLDVPNTSMEIQIVKVSVIPQVVGSLLSMSLENGLHESIQELNEVSVTFDVGYGTFLWLTTRGYKPQIARTSGISAGASVVLQQAISVVTGSNDAPVSLLEKVDQAVRLKHDIVRIDSTVYSIRDFKDKINSIVSEFISQAMRGIGSMRDVDHFFLAGGGSHLYRDALKERLGSKPLIESQGDPQFCNVRGFQIYSQQHF